MNKRYDQIKRELLLVQCCYYCPAGIHNTGNMTYRLSNSRACHHWSCHTKLQVMVKIFLVFHNLSKWPGLITKESKPLSDNESANMTQLSFVLCICLCSEVIISSVCVQLLGRPYPCPSTFASRSRFTWRYWFFCVCFLHIIYRTIVEYYFYGAQWARVASY